MALDLRQNLKLDLQLRLAPQIIQSIELLQLPAIDLAELIDQQLDTNEFLEKVEPGESPADDQETADREEPRSEEAEIREEEIERLEQADIWDDPSLRRPIVRDEEALNAKLEAMQNAASNGPSLQDHLLDQYRLLDLEERYEPLAEQIIYNIDDNGYVAYPLEEVLEDVADNFTLKDAEYVLSRIQRLDPPGVGARTREECLALQLKPDDPRFELKLDLIENHLDDLFRNRLPKVAKAVGLGLDELKDVLHEMADLTLRPGTRGINEANRYIAPDLVLEWDGNEYSIRLANEYVPELRLSTAYRDVLRSRDVPKAYREYVKEKVDAARHLINSVQKRQKTLLDVARLIVNYQRDFFDYGPHYLRPLKMQQVADDLGVHVSTISRATSDKYIQTHRGIFSLKDFFTGGTQSADGQVESREAVKQKVREIIEREDKQQPLSDDEIVERLRGDFGLKVARRTVTKYRKALGIPSSRQRREY